MNTYVFIPFDNTNRENTSCTSLLRVRRERTRRLPVLALVVILPSHFRRCVGPKSAACSYLNAMTYITIFTQAHWAFGTPRLFSRCITVLPENCRGVPSGTLGLFVWRRRISACISDPTISQRTESHQCSIGCRLCL